MGRVGSVLAALERRPVLAVGLLWAAAAALTAVFTTRMTGFSPDEITYTRLAIEMGDTMRPFALDPLGRTRLNQLYPLTLAPLYLLWDNVGAYRAAHVWNAILIASSTVPAYLLGRALLPRRWAAYLLAALVAFAPWITMASVQHVEVAAYPATVWALLAMQRALTAPSGRRDLVALLTIGVATFARLQLVVLAPLFVAAVILHETGWALLAPAGERSARLREVARAHRMLLGAAVLGLLIGLPLLLGGVVAERVGFYGNTLSGDIVPPGTLEAARENAVALFLGVGAVPAVLAVGGWLVALVRPPEKAVHAFSVLCLLVFCGIVLQVAAVNLRFNGTYVQERYVMFLGPALLAGVLVGVARTRRPLAAVLAGTIVVAGLIAVNDYPGQTTAYWYMNSPGITTFLDVIAPRLAAVAGLVGEEGASRYALMALLTVVMAGLVAVALRRWPRTRSLAVLGGLTLAFCTVVTAHAFVRLLYGGDSGPGLGGGTIADANWVDRSVPADQPVSLVARQTGQIADARERWWRLEFWNREIANAYTNGAPYYTWNTGRPMAVDRRTGELVTDAQRSRYLVSSTSGVPLALAGRRVATSPDGALALTCTAPEAHVRWMLTGVSDDGWMGRRDPATLSVFGPERVRVTLAAPAGLAAPRRVEALGPGGRRHQVEVPAGGRASITLGGGPGRARFRTLTGPGDAAPGVTAQVVSIAAEAE